MSLPASTLVWVVDLRISTRGVPAFSTATSTPLEAAGAARAAALAVATLVYVPTSPATGV